MLMKKYFSLIALGFINGVIPLGLLVLTGNDLRYLFISAIILLFTTGLISNRWKINPLVTIILLIAPLVLGFSVLILSEVTSLGYLIIPWIVSLLVGVFWRNLKSLKSARTLSILSLILIVVFFNFNFIPHILRSVLSKELNEPSLNFEISKLDGSIISSSEFKGKTVVIDFFGTWCGPCILELPELEKVKNHFKNENNLVFLIVNSDQPGDSPEKTSQFKIKHGFDFDFFYDCNTPVILDQGFS